MGDAENLDIYLKAHNETNPAFKGVDQNVTGLQTSAHGLSGTLKNVTAGFADISGAINVAGTAINQIRGAYDMMITKTLEWGATVEDFGRLIGENAENSSRLIITAEQIGISQDSLRQAMETAISKGVRPNIEGMLQLADQYNAIEDPIERSAFLMEKFGRRAGPEMAELLALGREGMEKYLETADKTGKVIDEKAIAAAERYERMTAKLDQRIEGLTVRTGTQLVPTLSVLIDTMMMNGDAVEENNLRWTKAIPILDGIITLYLSIKNAIQATTAMTKELNEETAKAPAKPTNTKTPGRAGGGPVWSNLAVPVGENGPEWFVPKTSGTIIPANQSPPQAAASVIVQKLEIIINGGEQGAVRREVEMVIRDLQAVGRLS